jgi:hypothetical protein
MRSSKGVARGVLTICAGVALALSARPAHAQQQAAGFDLERLYTSAPGGGWFVMDALDMHGKLGGAVSAVASYAHNPLRVTDGVQRLTVVSDEAFLQLGFAATYDRFRLYFTFDSPLTVQGNSGTLGGYTFTRASVDPASSPDAISHARFGFDSRLVGDHAAPFRLGIGLQLWVPGGAPGALRENYLSDGSPGDSLGAYNAMARVLFAGDIGVVTYAGHVGLHLRQLSDSATPGSPQGSEALFGAAGGAKLSLCAACGMRFVIGPEIFGASALRALLGANTTALEGLLTGRVEGNADDAPQFRIKLGIGGGLNAHFGAPDARVVIGVELFEFGTK